MTVKSGQTWSGIFECTDSTGALATPSVGPVGTLYINGLSNAATITITGSNPFKFSVTLPSLSPGDRVDMYITATISSIATASIIASEQADTSLLSDIGTSVSGLATTTHVQEVENKLDIVDGIVDAVKLTTDALPAAVAPANEYDVALAAIQADLDNPDQYKSDVSGIPAAVWGYATRTLSSFGTLVADIWSYVTRTITAFGFTVATNSDANVSAIKIKTDNLPTLPAATGDPMTLTSGERTAIANEVESQIINETDAERVLTAITDKIASVNPSLDDLTLAGIASAVRTELGTELARIDAAISSRLATSSYTAPANADVAAIKAKTDNLPSDPADQSILAGLIAGLPAAPSEADIITALKASVFDGLLTFEDSIKLYNAILFGKLDGGGSGTLKYRDPADTKDRVTAVVDLSNGDRDDITLDIT